MGVNNNNELQRKIDVKVKDIVMQTKYYYLMMVRSSFV